MSLIDREKTMEEIPIDVCDGFEVTDIIEKMPPVKAIPIPEGATNGDMIKAMFPNMEIEECNKDINGNPNIYRIYGLSGVAEFGKEFWNAPYKRGSENG